MPCGSSNFTDTQGNRMFDEATFAGSELANNQETMYARTSSASASGSLQKTQKLRVRRSTFVSWWAMPPRVLLVNDDAVTRKLSSKFLQILGCTFDGAGAVNKMNLEKYDLVLMDISMPRLDGVSATSMIRKFDPHTPIIYMTSSSRPSEIMIYYSSGPLFSAFTANALTFRSTGMNDILLKPFTKQGLLDILEVRTFSQSLILRAD
ncbi:CheY-like superfamily [Mycena epipterygia]|nr:CheY-like superfamily [Mycena epipterygia]